MTSTREMKLKPRQAPMSPPAWARNPTPDRDTTLMYSVVVGCPK